VAEFTLNQAQSIIKDRVHQNLIYQGGSGSGKTTCGPHAIFTRMRDVPPGTLFGAVGPTFRSVRRNIVETLERESKRMGVPYEFLSSAQEVRLAHVRVQLASADKPQSLAGPNWAAEWLDEPANMAKEAINECTLRLRSDGLPHQQAIFTGTPRGTHTYLQELMRKAETWPSEHPGEPNPICAVIAPTWLNAKNLPKGFIENHRDVTFKNDPAGFSNFILGKAMDRAGSIYTNFQPHHRRKWNPDMGQGQLVVGWDFNVRFMATIIARWYPSASVLHVIAECNTKTESPTTTELHAERVVELLLRKGWAAMDRGRLICRSEERRVGKECRSRWSPYH
jgi:hypothetical protein